MNSPKNNKNPPKKEPEDIDDLEDTEDPTELFRKAVGAVKPVNDDRVLPSRKPVSTKPRQLELDERAVMQDAMHDERNPDELDTGEHLSWCRSGVQKRVMKKLRNGYYSIQNEIDLHGLTVAQAREALAEFMAWSVDKHKSTCVRIIHGKGRKTADTAPVLKPFVSSWLRGHKQVVAFTSCKPVHGGTGAVYVLLQRAGTE